MKCAQALPLLSGYMDQELTVDEMRRVAAHLESCRSCEAELRRLEQTQSLLGTLASPHPPEGFWAETYERLERSHPRLLPLWQRLSFPQRSAMVLTPVVVVASILTLFSLQSNPAPDTLPFDNPPSFNGQLVDDLVQ